MKPYISRINNTWEVLNSEGDVAYSTKDFELAQKFFKRNYKKLRG